MGRSHLFEFEDQGWCPDFLRNYLTDYLKHFEQSTGLYEECIPLLEKSLQRSGSRKVVDLCSGSSGPWTYLVNKIEGVNVTLTDFFPNQKKVAIINNSSDLPIKYHETPVDAMNVDDGLSGLRTLFTSFHHFRPEQAKRILNNAIEKNQSVAVFEFTERKSFNYIFYPFLSLLGVWLTTPMIRPFSWSRILFTYLIPIVPLITIWDGYISNLRTYSVDELRSLIDSLEVGNYDFDIGQLKTKTPGINITYLLALPKEKVTLTDRNEAQPSRAENAEAFTV